LEADSKFFRSLTVALIVAPYVFVPQSLDALTQFAAACAVVVLAIGAGLSQQADRLEARQKGDRVASRKSSLLDIAAIIYGLVFVFLLAGSVLIIPADLMPWLAVVYWVVAMCSFLRFAQLRWQRNETAYEFFLSIRTLETSTQAPAT
jgi:hypothetical protein